MTELDVAYNVNCGPGGTEGPTTTGRPHNASMTSINTAYNPSGSAMVQQGQPQQQQQSGGRPGNQPIGVLVGSQSGKQFPVYRVGDKIYCQSSNGYHQIAPNVRMQGRVQIPGVSNEVLIVRM